MNVLADRFAVVANGGVIDLATGDMVSLEIGSAGGVSDQLRWAMRCDMWQKLHHAAIAPLVDFGVLGESQRFEAWRCGSTWTASPMRAERVLTRASTFLRASGLTIGAVSPGRMRSSAIGPVLLPDHATGHPCDRPVPAAGDVSVEACGLTFIDRPAIRALAELFEQHAERRPQVVAVWGPPGAGRTTVVLNLARVARLNGFVPVATRLLDPACDRAFCRAEEVAAAVRGRSLFLIDEERAPDGERRHRRHGWRAVVEASLRSPAPHVLMLAGVEEEPSVHGIALDRVSTEALVSAVRPAALDPTTAKRVRRMAHDADGCPGRFARLIWPDTVEPDRARSRRGGRAQWRAAEQPAIYTIDGSDAGDPTVNAAEPKSWPAPGELAALRRRLETALRQLQSGRHAAGDRGLRQAIGGLARRDDWSSAGQGAVALAGALLDRGRPRAALDVLDQARDYWRRAGQDAPLLDVAIGTGTAWTDLARLDEAESVLGAALAAARAHEDARRAASARVALARCAFWRGRYAEAVHAADATDRVDVDEGTRVAADAVAASAAIGLRELDRAMQHAADAVGRSQAAGNHRLIAVAAGSRAFVHLAVGDLDAVERDVAGCVAAARAGHDPLRALHGRLILAERARRLGRTATAAAVLRRIMRVAAASLPATLRAPCDLLKELLLSESPADRVLSRHVAATGLHALGLWLPAADRHQEPLVSLDVLVRDFVEIVHICQHAEEESRLLQDVCRRLRHQLNAAAVGFVVREGQARAVLAADGPRIDGAVAERAFTAGVAIAPHQLDDRIEAAVPVRYGGEPIAVLVARWTLGSPHELSRATNILTMAATASAPALAAAQARRAQATSAGPTELLGVSAAIAEVRTAVERTASAPFAVLIEGESGSGKELVARALHRRSARRDRPFCTLNCAALPDDLVETELFGHARGAFTGAVGERTGVFEEANGGTLFLDEIGELSARAQAKVLRTLQEGELRRVGENVSRRVDVRIVAATNRDLRQEVAASRFRLDLLFRLDVVRIVVPPLRERREDIAVLVDRFWHEAAARVGCRATLAATTVAALARYDWPGNVRELQNVLAALAVRCAKRGVVPPTALPPQFGAAADPDTWRLDDARRTFEERFVRAALVRAGGHRTRAAEELGVTRQGLTKLMTRLGIRPLEELRD